MEGARATVNNKKLVFATNGDLVDTTGADEAVKGTWTAGSAQKKNEIGYTLDGANQPPLAAVYKFNKRNQLQVSVGGGTATTAFTYPGRIEVDSNHNFTYFVI